MSSRRFGLIAIGAASACVLVMAAVLARQYSIRAPDPNRADLKDCFQFIASDDFNALWASRRHDYATKVFDRLIADNSLEALLLMTLDPANRALRKRMDANLKKLPDYKVFLAHLSGEFLEKFYAMSPFKRKAYLFTAALASKDPGSGVGKWDKPKLSTFFTQLRDLTSLQKPRAQALTFQFLLDFRNQRDSLGIKSPF